MLAEKITVPDDTGVVVLVSPNADLHQRLRAAFKDDPRANFVAIQGGIGSRAAPGGRARPRRARR